MLTKLTMSPLHVDTTYFSTSVFIMSKLWYSTCSLHKDTLSTILSYLLNLETCLNLYAYIIIFENPPCIQQKCWNLILQHSAPSFHVPSSSPITSLQGYFHSRVIWSKLILFSQRASKKWNHIHGVLTKLTMSALHVDTAYFCASVFTMSKL